MYLANEGETQMTTTDTKRQRGTRTTRRTTKRRIHKENVKKEMTKKKKKGTKKDRASWDRHERKRVNTWSRPIEANYNTSCRKRGEPGNK